MAGSISSSCGCICSCVSFVRIIRSANGPPIIEPAIRPKVAAAIPIVPAPCRPMPSKTLANPPAVPCPPVIDILPAAIPIKGSTPKSLVIPSGMMFCIAIMTTNRTSMMIKSLPPCFNTFRSLWKPTLVKNASIKAALNVPLNDTSTLNQPYNIRVINEKMIPPLTGDGTQNFWRKATFRVKTIPTRRAKAPTPAVCIISSSILTILTILLSLESILQLDIGSMSVYCHIITDGIKHIMPINA